MMETSTTKEQARTRRKHFGRQNSDPFYTLSYTSKVAAQDETAPCPSDQYAPEDPAEEIPAKEPALA